MNQALAAVLPHLNDDDVVLTMDADSQLTPDFVATGLRYLAYSPSRGAISGSYRRVRTQHGRPATAYRVCPGPPHGARRGGRIHVLSGAACMFTVKAFRAVASRAARPAAGAARVGLPPGVAHRGLRADPRPETHRVRAAERPRLRRRHGVMTTWESWRAQRLRWQRGPWTRWRCTAGCRHTRKAWVVQFWTYFRSLVPLLMVLFWAYACCSSGHFRVLAGHPAGVRPRPGRHRDGGRVCEAACSRPAGAHVGLRLVPSRRCTGRRSCSACAAPTRHGPRERDGAGMNADTTSATCCASSPTTASWSRRGSSPPDPVHRRARPVPPRAPARLNLIAEETTTE